MTGRQILYMVRESFRTEAHMDVFYNMQDLMAVRWAGDDHMQKFLEKWDTVTEGMGPETIHEKTLRDLFLEQVSCSTVLQEDVAHYHRLKPTYENKTLGVSSGGLSRSNNQGEASIGNYEGGNIV